MNKRIPITPLRLPLFLKEEAQGMAEKLGVSLSELIKFAIVDYLAKYNLPENK